MCSDPAVDVQGAVTADRSRLEGDLGFQYFKLAQDRADAAWEKIHTITRWNYAAFGAGSVVLGADYAGAAERASLLPVLCSFVIAASMAAAVLAWMHMNYALYLFFYAYEIEKAWLRRKSRSDVVEKIKLLRKSQYNKRSQEWPLKRDTVLEMVSSIHFWTNILPGVVAIVAWMALPSSMTVVGSETTRSDAATTRHAP